MGAGAAGTSASAPTGLMVSKMLACFTRAKLLKISAFLLRAVCAATALLEIGMAPVVRRCSGKMNLSRPPSSRSSATSAYRTRNTFAQHRAQGQQVFGENNFFFDGRVFRLMGHRELAKYSFKPLSSLAL